MTVEPRACLHFVMLLLAAVLAKWSVMASHPCASRVLVARSGWRGIPELSEVTGR
jgi:hypothetical protein